ncbi:MAG: HNH endonuclease [Verrucomicrobiota bacterium]|jgi:5-methylcytosine-specific restriction endonuclease McrA
MKFELEPHNRGVSDEVLLDDLRKVANKLGKEFLTQEEYNNNGRRFLVMDRDNFKCFFCGRTKDDGIKLVVDHFIPWDDYGETVMENLRTSCEPCNSGKSNLPIKTKF